MKILIDLVNRVAKYVGETTPSTDTIDDIKDSINEAVRMLAETYPIYNTDNVVVDLNCEIDTSTLSKNFIKLVEVTKNDESIYTVVKDKIKCYGVNPGDSVAVKYTYWPDEITDNNAEVILPDNVSWRTPCYYAAYMYYVINGDEEGKSAYWINLWNDTFKNVVIQNVQSNVIENIY